MGFRKTVENASPPVNGAYREGIRALEHRHRRHVTCGDPRRLSGSIDLDQALAREPEHASAPRWDYGIGYKPENGPEQAIWIRGTFRDTKGSTGGPAKTATASKMVEE